jgi:hypothetical protein
VLILLAYTSLLRLALPSTARSQEEGEEHDHAEHTHVSTHPSRAPSVRSMRSTHSLRGASAAAPTLPDGAEQMLEKLRPSGKDEDEDEFEDAQEVPRPQFVEQSDAKTAVAPQLEASGSSPTAKESDAKGWKEVA